MRYFLTSSEIERIVSFLSLILRSDLQYNQGLSGYYRVRFLWKTLFISFKTMAGRMFEVVLTLKP